MGCTPLHHAVFAGSLETISAIVQAGVYVNAASEWFGIPLCLAAIHRDLAAMTFLISHNASVNKDCGKLGPVAHAACTGGDMAVIRALYAAGADFQGSADICVRVLCHLSQLARNGTSLAAHRNSSLAECPAQSPGAVAVRFRHYEAVEFCLGLREHLFVHKGLQVLTSYPVPRSSSSSISATDPRTKISFLSLAMSTLDIRTSESLLYHGARDIPMDPVGRGALAHALDATRLKFTNDNDLERCVKLLIRHGIDIDGLQGPNDRQARGADQFVATWGRNYASGQLLNCPAIYLSEPPEAETTALMYTICRGNDLKSLVHCVEVLCNNGARVDVRDKYERSTLSLARDYLEGEEKIEVEMILLRHSNMQPVEQDIGRPG